MDAATLRPWSVNLIPILRERLVCALPSQADELRTQLRQATHNQATAERLLSAYRTKNPSHSETEALEAILFQLQRDQR